MKGHRFKLFFILLAILLCVYFLYPTFQDYQNNKEITNIIESKRDSVLSVNPDIDTQELELFLSAIDDSIRSVDPDYIAARQKRIKLGLDLQGGMRVVLEVNTGELLANLAKNPDETFNTILRESINESELSDESVVTILGNKLQDNDIRLSRYFGTIRQDDSDILSELESQADDAVTRAIEIIRNRVDQYGVSEPSIQRQGARRVIVELPGVAKEEEARQLLQGVALLEFRIVKDPEFAINLMQRIDEYLAGKTENDTISDTDTTSADLSAEEFARKHPFFNLAWLDPQGQTADAYVSERNKTQLQLLFSRPDIQRIIPNNAEFLFSSKPIGFQDGQSIYVMYLVNRTPELTGGVITNAMANIDPTSNQPIVTMEMNSEGAREWARITGANIDKRCAIILDGVVFSAPVIRGRIPGGRSQIEGMADIAEAKLLEIILKAGALPAPVQIIEERTVGPSLGQDSVRQGFNSALFGFLLVAVFMIFYYQKAGTIAGFSLVFTILFILGVLAGFSATLTLPGIAGIILTIGMAVDAQVLIYERIREEIATGKTARASVDSGFANAYSAIIDSNITTFFTGIILYQFGTGPIQGFALTLMIGIAASLFSALVITRLVFDYMVAKNININIG